LKVMVCGAIAYRGVSEIKRMQSLLKEKGFEVVDQISDGDYSQIEDFRDERDLAKKIAVRDLDLVKESDVVVALVERPSYGVAIEVYFAKMTGKKVVLMSRGKMPSPWPMAFSDQIVYDEEELISALKLISSHLF
jgi:nucleoside 2-deoxyribosyltransferase